MLEICIVLAIMAVLVGTALPSVSSWLDEERLRGPARALELMARTARLRAIDRQRPYALVIGAEGIAMEPASEGAPEAGLPRLSLPPSVAVATRPWGAEGFSAAAPTRWLFEPDGLCQPLAVRFSRNGSELALRFDPLTASATEESYAFR